MSPFYQLPYPVYPALNFKIGEQLLQEIIADCSRDLDDKLAVDLKMGYVLELVALGVVSLKTVATLVRQVPVLWTGYLQELVVDYEVVPCPRTVSHTHSLTHSLIQYGIFLISQYTRQFKENSGEGVTAFTTDMWYDMTPNPLKITLDQADLEVIDVASADNCLYPTQLSTGTFPQSFPMIHQTNARLLQVVRLIPCGMRYIRT